MTNFILMKQPSLADRVESLERRHRKLHELCGTMLATLDVNKEMIGPQNPTLQGEWNRIVEGWRKRFEEAS